MMSLGKGAAFELDETITSYSTSWWLQLVMSFDTSVMNT